MFTVVLRSRNKDNEGVKDFRERKKVFLVREFEPYMGEREEEVDMYKEFDRFVQDGVNGETSRLYISVNSRDKKKIQRDLFIEIKPTAIPLALDDGFQCSHNALSKDTKRVAYNN